MTEKDLRREFEMYGLIESVSCISEYLFLKKGEIFIYVV